MKAIAKTHESTDESTSVLCRKMGVASSTSERRLRNLMRRKEPISSLTRIYTQIKKIQTCSMSILSSRSPSNETKETITVAFRWQSTSKETRLFSLGSECCRFRTICRRGVNIYLIAKTREDSPKPRKNPFGSGYPVLVCASLASFRAPWPRRRHRHRGYVDRARLPHDAAVSLCTIYNGVQPGTGPIHGELNFPNFDRASSTARCNLYRPTFSSSFPVASATCIYTRTHTPYTHIHLVPAISLRPPCCHRHRATVISREVVHDDLEGLNISYSNGAPAAKSCAK